MSTLLWILAGFIAYSLPMMLLHTRGTLPEYVRVQGPLTAVHIRRGREPLDGIATLERFWRAWSNVGLGIVLVVVVGTFVLPVFQMVVTL